MKILISTILIFLFASQYAFGITVTPNQKFIVLPGTKVGVASVAKKINLQINSHSQALMVYINAPMQLSSDSINYATSISIPASNVAHNVNIYVRSLPQLQNKVFKSQVVFVHNNNDTSFNRLYLQSSSMPSDSFYTMLTWNIRWFGDPGSCNCDTAAQYRNVRLILKELQPDLIALQEIVRTDKLAGLAAQLGNNYSSNFSTFCSFAPNVSDPDYAGGQKLAYIYNNALFENIRTYGLGITQGTSNSSPYYYFSSGRFPYVMEAKVKGTIDTLMAINIHAKASTTNSDYNRRASGGAFIADTLNAQYANKNAMVLGDYNDYLQGTDVATQTLSPYQYMLSNGLNGISLPSLYPNTTTYASIANSIIDNFAANNKLYANYVPGTFTVLNQLDDVYWSYSDSASDHFPAMVYMKKSFGAAVPLAVENVPKDLQQIKAMYYANSIVCNWSDINTNLPIIIKLYNSNGALLENNILPNTSKKWIINTQNYISGLYIIELQINKQKHILKVQM